MINYRPTIPFKLTLFRMKLQILTKKTIKILLKQTNKQKIQTIVAKIGSLLCSKAETNIFPFLSALTARILNSFFRIGFIANASGEIPFLWLFKVTAFVAKISTTSSGQLFVLICSLISIFFNQFQKKKKHTCETFEIFWNLARIPKAVLCSMHHIPPNFSNINFKSQNLKKKEKKVNMNLLAAAFAIASKPRHVPQSG